MNSEETIGGRNGGREGWSTYLDPAELAALPIGHTIPAPGGLERVSRETERLKSQVKAVERVVEAWREGGREGGRGQYT